MRESYFKVSERARALRNPAKTGPLVYYPSGWGTGHTERSAGPTMVSPADRSHPPTTTRPAWSFVLFRYFSSLFSFPPFVLTAEPPHW